MTLSRTLLAAGVILLAGGIPALAQPGVDGVVREGEGSRRAELNKKERKPFDAALWSKVADWKNGPALTAAAAKGRPVLVLTWTDYMPTSKRPLQLAKQLSEEFKSEGLIVVCVHSKEDWAAASKPAAGKDAMFLLAHDATGGFREGISSDADPDFYVIDRAGQLRFADIETDAVRGAVEIVVKESEKDAGGINERLSAEAKARDDAGRRTGELRGKVDLTALPEIPFDAASDDDYTKAKWPSPPKDEQSFRDPNRDPNEPEPPQPVTIPEANWYPAKPELKGRVVVMYFWHPEARVSWQRDIAVFDLMQRQRSRDLVVVGVLSPLFGAGGGQERLKIETDPDKLKKKIDEFRASRNTEHYILVDSPGTFWEMSGKNYQNFQQARPAPWIAIISSDNKMRWWGWGGDPKGQAALDKILAIDPGVQARRKAEEAYIRAKEGK